MTRILQLSDLHVVAEGARANGVVDTAAALSRAVATANDLVARTGPVDCVIVTGDLVDHGEPSEYAHLRRLLAPLASPLAVIPGNHDARDALRAAFADLPTMPASGPVNWRLTLGGLALIGLDSLVPGAPAGALSDETLAWLSAQIRELDGAPLVVGVHHPPFETGIPFMDRQGMTSPHRLAEVLRAHRGPCLVVSGHVHRTILATGGPVPMAIGPSPAHAVSLDPRADAAPSFVMEPGGMLLHELRDTADGPRLVSQVVPAGRFDGPHPFEGRTG